MSGHCPPTRNSSRRSKNWPWMSPQIYVSHSKSSQRVVRPCVWSCETDGDGRVDPLDVCLLDEDLSGLEAEVLDLLFGYRLAALHVHAVSRAAESVCARASGDAPIPQLLDLTASGRGRGRGVRRGSERLIARTDRSRLDDMPAACSQVTRAGRHSVESSSCFSRSSTRTGTCRDSCPILQ